MYQGIEMKYRMVNPDMKHIITSVESYFIFYNRNWNITSFNIICSETSQECNLKPFTIVWETFFCLVLEIMSLVPLILILVMALLLTVTTHFCPPIYSIFVQTEIWDA